MRNCPFCASKDCRVRTYNSPVHTRVVHYRVQCDDCGAEGPQSKTKDGAISKWNGKLMEDVMGGVATPAATLSNVPGMGNAVPAGADSIGSGDKFGDDIASTTSDKKEKSKKNQKKTHKIKTLSDFLHISNK